MDNQRAKGTASNGRAAAASASRSTRSSGKAKKIHSLAEINKAHRAKIQNASRSAAVASTSLAAVKRDDSSQPATNNGGGGQMAKRKGDINGDRNKRQRQQYQPFQSTTQPSTSSSSSTAKAPKENSTTTTAAAATTTTTTKEKIEQMIIYNRGDFLAIRNEFNEFFLCRARQNIYKNGNRIKISWYNDDINPGEYIPDFDDDIDFETILTNVRINRIDSKRIELPEAEHQRVQNILQRAIGVEQGIHEAPDPTKLLGDGLDISILGQEDELLKNMKPNGVKSKGSKRSSTAQTNGVKAQTNGISKSSTSNGLPAKNRSTSPENIKNECSDLVMDNGSTSSADSNTANNNSRKNSPAKRGDTSILHSSTPFRTRTNRRQTQSTSTAEPPMDTSTTNGHSTSQLDLTSSTIENLPLDTTTASTGDQDDQLKDLMFDSKTDLPFISLHANSKLLIRAVLLKDHEELSRQLEPTTTTGGKILSVATSRSVSIKRNALHYSLLNEDFVSLTRLLKVSPETLVKDGDNSGNIIQSMELLHSELTLDQDSCHPHFDSLDSSYAKFAIKNYVSLDFIQNALGYFQNGLTDFTDHLVAAVKSGNFPVASFLAKSNSAEFNASHLMYFEPWDARKVYVFTPSVNDWSIARAKIGPLHLAAINPDPFLFTSIVSDCMDQLNVADVDGWTCLHYAAVCSTFFNLQHLLSFGVSTMAINSKGDTPLHLAVSCNRLENVALIVSEEKLQSACSSCLSLKAYNAHGWTPLHVACKRGFLRIVRYFIENNVELDTVTSSSSGELTPLMIACQHGHLAIVRLLIDHGASVNTIDKKNRCPLTYAVMNGHAHVAAALLKSGANPSAKDMFGNNLFHYALAYGWFFAYETLLQQTNGNLRETNMFGLTPLCVAFMKGHIGLVEDVLRRGLLSVNAPVNDSGVTLCMLAFSLAPGEGLLRSLKLFVETFRCELAKTDYNGNSTLHYFLQCESKHKCQSSPATRKALQDALAIIQKCDPYAANNAGVSPLAYAVQNDCFLTFLHYFKADLPKCSRIMGIINGNERFWRLVINHLLEIVPSSSTKANSSKSSDQQESPLTFGRFLSNLAADNKQVGALLSKLALKTNKNGELPVEFFIKAAGSNQVLKNSNSARLSPQAVEKEVAHFLCFLLRLYDRPFLHEHSLLHLAAKYSSAVVVRTLVQELVLLVETPVDPHGSSPLVLAIVHRNYEAAVELLRLDADPAARFLQHGENISAFLYELKHNSGLTASYEFTATHLLSRVRKFNEKDKEGNNALHLLTRRVALPYSTEVATVLVEKINVNSVNAKGETPLHIALRENAISPALIAFFGLLLKKEADLYKLDDCSRSPLNYLMKRSGADPQLLRLLQLLDTKDVGLLRHQDVKQASLLFNCAESGNAVCLAYLKAFMDCNKVDIRKYTPLAAAVINGHKDCAQILIRSDFEIRNCEFSTALRESDFPTLEKNRVNLFSSMMKYGWKDLMFEILDKAKSNKRLLEFLHCLLKNNCIEFAIPAIKIAKDTLLLERHTYKSLLSDFSKNTTRDVSLELQLEFLQQFPEEIVNDSFVELFINALENWNYALANDIIRKRTMSHILYTMGKDRRPENLISVVFMKVLIEEPLFEEMKTLILLFLGLGYQLNSLWRFPIAEDILFEDGIRYRYFKNFANHQVIPYSALIVAVMRGDHEAVRWLLNLKKKDGQYEVDVDYDDSYHRTPMMHAIMGNDLKMIKLLLNRNYNHQEDTDCWTTTNSSLAAKFENVNGVDLLRRDTHKSTLFRYLILPFEYFNYAKAPLIFKFLWDMLEERHKNSELVNDLYKIAHAKHVRNICWLLEEIEPIRLTAKEPERDLGPPPVKPVPDLLKDHENQMAEYMKSPRVIRSEKRNILVCDTTGIAYDTTLTKLDSQQDQYIFNFYKLQIFTVHTKFALITHWGRIGTKGNVSKVFYDQMQEAVDEFKRLFQLKSGQAWNEVYEEEGINGKHMLQKNRNLEFTKTCKYMSYDTDVKSPEFAAQSELSDPLKDLIIRWIEAQAQSCTYTKSPAYCTLNSKVLENCQEILQKIYHLLLKIQLSKSAQQKKCSLKLMYEIINLSEEFYSEMVIYGNDFDQQPPITTMADLLEKAQHVHRLKGLFYARELVHLASRVEERNPVDYMYEAFRFEMYRLRMVSTTHESRDYMLLELYLKNAFRYRFFLSACFRVLPKFPFETNKHSHLLWYTLDEAFIFQSLVKGLQPEPISYPNSHVILQGIKLTNELKYTENHCDKVHYYLLCEAKLERVLHVKEGSSIDDCSLEQYDSIISYPRNASNDHLQHYLSWKGYTVPYRKDHHPGPTEFIVLNPNMVTPRYLIELRSVPPF